MVSLAKPSGTCRETSHRVRRMIARMRFRRMSRRNSFDVVKAAIAVTLWAVVLIVAVAVTLLPLRYLP